MTRDDLQREAVDTLERDNRLILQWTTSLGKGTMAVKAVSRLKPDKVLLVVAETAHKKNWKDEFIKFGVEELFTSIVTECYASLKNYRNTKWDLIIFDEAHHLGSELKTDILKSLHSKRVLVLSATLSDASLISSLESTFGKFQFSKITFQEAIDNGFLPKPKIFLIPLQLEDSIRNQTVIEEWGKSEKRVRLNCLYPQRWNFLKAKKTLYPNASLTIYCTAYEKYCYLSSQFEFWQQRYFATRNKIIKNKWLQFGLKRKMFMGSLKTENARELISSLGNKKFICFCTNVEQAIELGGENAIHYKNKETAEVISSFNNDERKALFAVGMLQEGQNLSNIEAGIIIQLDGKERPFIQKFGRSMRAEDPVQYIFYYKNTKDEEYLKNVIEGIDKNYIQDYSYENNN